MVYQSFLSKSEIKRRVNWQNKCYREHLRNNKRITIDFHGRKIIILHNVFSPVPWEHNLLSKTVLKEVKKTDKVLDMGTGTGIQAILAASISKYVIAVDVNPFAVTCAKLNVKLNKLSSNIQVIESDLFESVEGKFDVVIFDPPFRWTKPRDIWEKSCADENYTTMNKFFSQVNNFLNPEGKILIHFGTSGDLSYLKKIIRKNGFNRKQIYKNSRTGWTYFSYRLTLK